VAANVLLGVNQGICWSTTVIMKIDLVGPARRGLAMGLNEFAGYLAVALSALATGYIAGAYGLRPEPFYLGIAIAVLGLGSSVFLVRETRHHAAFEARFHQPRSVDETNTTAPSFRQIFALATWKDRTLFNCSQVGLVNNLNDGMAWGLFPLLFALEGLSVDRIGILAATYPAVWGMTQLCTGVLSDRWGRKWLIVWGMWVQAVGIVTIVAVHGWASWITGSVLLGVGTAMVYPTLLAAVSDVAPPQWRASAVGVYRLWRDLGYAVGAVISGILADRLGLGWAIGAIAGLTFLSGTVAALFMPAARPAAFKAQVHQIKE
jgi:MFS family permease